MRTGRIIVNETKRGYRNRNYRAAMWIMAVIGAGLGLVYALDNIVPLTFDEIFKKPGPGL
jgi:lipid-A-disaccharide synthase-like uncharacterized protein